MDRCFYEGLTLYREKLYINPKQKNVESLKICITVDNESLDCIRQRVKIDSLRILETMVA